MDMAPAIATAILVLMIFGVALVVLMVLDVGEKVRDWRARHAVSAADKEYIIYREPVIPAGFRSPADLRALAEETQAMEEAAEKFEQEATGEEFAKLAALFSHVRYWPKFTSGRFSRDDVYWWLDGIIVAYVSDHKPKPDGLSHENIKWLLDSWPQITADVEKIIQSKHTAAQARLDKAMQVEQPIEQRRAAALSTFLKPAKKSDERFIRHVSICHCCNVTYDAKTPGTNTCTYCLAEKGGGDVAV